MHGNVRQWCADGYGPYPKGDSSGTPGRDLVLRGGSWCNYPRLCRSADRYKVSPYRGSSNDGCRVVMSLD
jgi:formylglycine-generating enzyme required for sulfatase activity